MSHEITPSVAVVGAGIAGLACARRLVEAGVPVRLFDKARAPGGRVATRRVEGVGAFDHGAAFFTAREPAFRSVADALCDAGRAAPYAVTGHVHRLVGLPGMSGLPRALAEGLHIVTGTRIAGLTASQEGWRLTDAEGGVYGPFQALVIALPAPQAEALLAPAAPTLAARVHEADMAPCWAVMAAWDAPLPIAEGAIEAEGPVFSWAARESAKPGRAAGERWVIHAAADWSTAHLEAAPDAVIEAVLGALGEYARAAFPAPRYAAAHRWRYAQVITPLGAPCLAAPESRLVACGDWCLGPRIEDAFMSGRAAAEALIASL